MKGAFFAIKHALRPMLAAKSGPICVVCSDQSLVGKPEQNLYGLTKGALASLVRSCGAQYAPLGVRVNGVCPGTIDTPLSRGAVAQVRPRRARSGLWWLTVLRFAQIVAWKGKGSVEETLEWLQTAQPVPRMGEPAEVAHAVLAALTNGFMAGALVAVDGGYTCV